MRQHSLLLLVRASQASIARCDLLLLRFGSLFAACGSLLLRRWLVLRCLDQQVLNVLSMHEWSEFMRTFSGLASSLPFASSLSALFFRLPCPGLSCFSCGSLGSGAPIITSENRCSFFGGIIYPSGACSCFPLPVTNQKPFKE